MPKIVLTDVTKRWDSFYAVDHLDLTIDDCSFVTLLGPSGCGKTTTLRMIAGLETPTSGRIEIGDQVVFDSEQGINVPANKRKIGFLFQNYALWPNMTVYQNIAFGLKNMKTYTKEQIEERIRQVSALVKIEPFMKRYPAELSGGQQQRVAIARTLAPEPQVIFMDEPLSNLDAKLRLEMRSELQRLHLTTGRTFVYVTHDQMEAMTLASKICLIENGLLQQYDAPLTVYNYPNNLFVADFVGNPSINFVDACGDQNADGTMDFEILGGHQGRLTFAKPVRMTEWREALAKKHADREAIKEERRKDKSHVEKGNKDTVFKYPVATVDDVPANDAPVTERDYVLGIRPEFVKIVKEGGVEAEVYSAMPTGMETTVRLRVGNFLLTGVVFGGVTYEIGEKVHLAFEGTNVMLFDKGSGDLVGTGALEIK
ncbi:MAG: ABC transporter ATP-binding protein [Lachnospiraceae bacterium]|nr:ABC transporter ATP-binding protein [Lachnospiraceae bacterium]